MSFKSLDHRIIKVKILASGTFNITTDKGRVVPKFCKKGEEEEFDAALAEECASEVHGFGTGNKEGKPKRPTVELVSGELKPKDNPLKELKKMGIPALKEILVNDYKMNENELKDLSAPEMRDLVKEVYENHLEDLKLAAKEKKKAK